MRYQPLNERQRGLIVALALALALCALALCVYVTVDNCAPGPRSELHEDELHDNQRAQSGASAPPASETIAASDEPPATL